MTEVRRQNPSSSKEWVDANGRAWILRGGNARPLDERRVRTLLRSDGVLMAVWRSFEVEWFEDVDDKQAAIDRLREEIDARDLRLTEWRSDPATRLLLVENFC